MAKNQNDKKGILSTLGRWFRRMFFGASKELDVLEVEKLESPSKLAIKAFFRRKLAVAALIVLLSLFLFVFIGPYFFPMHLTYTDNLQANIAPNFSMLSVPSGLKGNIRDINGCSNFTVGVSNDNTLYMWGYTKDALTKLDYSKFPDIIEEGNVLMASAGFDHIIAITTDGHIVGWGNKNNGQYGAANEADGYISMDRVLSEAGFEKDGDYYKIPDTSKIEQLVCGYQATALVIDGHAYMWGNARNYDNMKTLAEKQSGDIAKVAMTNYRIVVMKDDGSVSGGKANFFFKQSAISSTQGKVESVGDYLKKSNVVDVTATKDSMAFLTDEGEVLIFGTSSYGEDKIVLPEEGKYIKLVGGSQHILGLTDTGKVYAWGYNSDGQTKISGKDADDIFTGSKQSYAVNEDDELTAKAGLRGYLFGTDNKGRDTFTRIVHGGKMTMTIGAVAVIVSSIIAIIIGCLSGYFGGWVDMLLMRITEIFSAIPFLPFAMMLSFIIRNYSIDENTRIFIIMVILGLLSWTGLARMIRAQVLAEREKEFVIAAKAMGVKESRIAFKHILPNIISVILVSMTLDFAGCLLTESSLSYLGFGVQLPQPTWGNMLNGANNSIVIQNYWWQWLFPPIFLSIATISINIIGDTLRDVLDPKSSQEK
ncbi:MAG: ABC transporter permease subunit [Clostridia bacterium]|nr:ABC transporter permease subunit [Clostridia bacterium]